VPFHPYYTMKDGFGVMVFMIVYAGFAFFAPDYMGHPDNYIPADPLVTPAHIVPEWYFLPFYAILAAMVLSMLPELSAGRSFSLPSLVRMNTKRAGWEFDEVGPHFRMS